MLAWHPETIGDDDLVEVGGWWNGLEVVFGGVEGGGAPDIAVDGHRCDGRGCVSWIQRLVGVRPGLDVRLDVLLNGVCRQSWTGWVVCDRDRFCADECADD